MNPTTDTTAVGAWHAVAALALFGLLALSRPQALLRLQQTLQIRRKRVRSWTQSASLVSDSKDSSQALAMRHPSSRH